VKFEDSFEVPVSLDKTWDALTDIDRVYPCLPGAQLIEVKDNEFHGLVSLKLGPISASYKGTARFDSLDRDNGSLVILAEGKDKHGQGMAKARISAVLIEEALDRTRVDMVNEIDITGKAAQFGRGILPDVSKAMMGQFADNLRAVVTAPPASESSHTHEAAAAPPTAVSAPINPASVAKSVLGQKFEESPGRTALTLVAPLLVVLFLLRMMKAR
jgi:carbon monoxide dehydrogenase subunit G